MTVEIFCRPNDNLYDWEPALSCSGGHDFIETHYAVTRIGDEAFPDWFSEINSCFYFTHEQIDLLAAVLRLNGIEVIER